MRKYNRTLVPIGIRHGNDGDDPDAATATAARCRLDDVAMSSTANKLTAVQASDVTDDVMPTPFPGTCAFRRRW